VTNIAPKVTLFAGADWHIEQFQKRTFVTGWEPFEGQENQQVRTLSPITKDIKEGYRIDMRAKWPDGSEGVDLFVQLERTTILSVGTSMYSYALDIGGEPHPIQSPKVKKQKVITENRIPVLGSLVLRGPDQPDQNHLTIVRCVFAVETPEVAEEVAEARKRGFPLPSEVSHDENAEQLQLIASAKKDPVANVYVDCGFDFTQAQIDEIAGQHDRFGFDSVQVRNGRLHVLAQDLAQVQSASIRFGVTEDNLASGVLAMPLIRGGENPAGKKTDYRVLKGALESLDIPPSQLEGHIDYTIDREWIELRASPMEILYGATDMMFRMRADEGVIRVSTSGRDLETLFEGNVEIKLGDWSATMDSLEVDDSGSHLRGNVVITSRHEDGNPQNLSSDKLFIDHEHEFESIEEMIAGLREQ